ncbi:hypothetical protein [Aeromonas cavernicola]|uniref:Uncharacterized protein n=1 Tax=Aeromonas cavernicola TaxID=1006623 RepID=A0A2H9U5H9_9GAMM|nr:hypothetical protein [Aeromonas cavernicola]PJG59282.1 hypothetical protein CUC53_08250 [Aeromonas cavernicola]
MQTKFIMLALSAALFSAGASATYRVDVKCLDEVTLTDIHAGYITTAKSGPDLGNAVVISWEKNGQVGETSFNIFKNLNDYPGMGFFDMAMLALDRGSPVSAWGNDATCSTGIHQFKIGRPKFGNGGAA